MSKKLFTIHSALGVSLFTNRKGFTLVELLITMVVFVFVLAAASQVFTGLLTQFKQQSKITETNIEGIVGLEMMRRDIESAGYGLPWNIIGVTDTDADGNFWEHLPNYNEAAAAQAATFNDATFDIDGDGNDGEAPRAVVSGNNMTYAGSNNIFDGSDYLVIKAVNVATSAASSKWTHLRAGNAKRQWATPPGPDDFCTPSHPSCPTIDERVIVLAPADAARQALVVLGSGAWSNTYANTAAFSPGATETRFIYGVDPDTNLRMPFNRADYYILKFDTSGDDIVPARCAPNTGILRKAIVNQGAGTFAGGTLPLIDCVADMQMVLGLDMNANGTIGTYTNGTTAADAPGETESAAIADVTATLNNAALIRQRVREVRVYILAHEGQRDPNFTFSGFTTGSCATCVRVGLSAALGRDFEFSTSGITNWQNYRWKVYSLVVKPNNLR